MVLIAFSQPAMGQTTKSMQISQQAKRQFMLQTQENVNLSLEGFLSYLSAYQCRLLITFANSLDPDQARHFVGPDLDPNYLTL